MGRLAAILSLVVPLLGAGWIARAETEFSAGLEAYRNGEYERAREIWAPLAEEGSAEAQFNLGLLWAQGLGVEQDSAQAAEWFGRAATAGFARAQYKLGEMYEAGDGVPTDRIRSFVFFKLAAQQKFEDAKKRRKRVADQMTPHEIAKAELIVREMNREARELSSAE